jgi:uncharacterized protein (TIGR03437 family)
LPANTGTWAANVFVGIRRAHSNGMFERTLLCVALLSASGATVATSGFLHGVDYSEWLGLDTTQIATDRSGALYILSTFPESRGSTPSWVTKLSLDGKTMLWQNKLGFAVSTMAVDPNGGVYVTPLSLAGDTSLFVAKLSADGTGVAWKTPVGFLAAAGRLPVLTADSLGRAYVAGNRTYVAGNYDPANNTADLVRLNAAGSAVDYTVPVQGIPTSITVGASGALVAGVGVVAEDFWFLARVWPDGPSGFYSIMRRAAARVPANPVVAVDANGDAVVYTSGLLQRFDSTGTITLSTTIPGELGVGQGFALDAAGNAYITGEKSEVYPVKNSVATCGSTAADLLSVFAPDGSLLQTTYIPGVAGGVPLVATAPNSTVYVVAPADATFAPTQAGPFPAGSTVTEVLLRLSPNANAQTFPLACLGNAATYETSPITPGELVTLFGNGLGPEQGIQPQATLQRPFPTQAASVEVTFDGTLAPLLWVQAAQINVVAPWSLTPGQTTQVCVAYNGVKTNCLSWPVVQSAPAVFTVDGVYAAALNQDGTINSPDNPAAPGSIISIFATGLGAISPAQADGSLVGLPLPNNVLPVGVEAQWATGVPFTPGITAFDVTYAGPAPFLVAGVSQINFKIVQYPVHLGQIFLVRSSGLSQGFQVYLAGQ